MKQKISLSENVKLILIILVVGLLISFIAKVNVLIPSSAAGGGVEMGEYLLPLESSNIPTDSVSVQRFR